MKKTIIPFVVLALGFAFAGCSGGEETPPPPMKTETDPSVSKENKQPGDNTNVPTEG